MQRRGPRPAPDEQRQSAERRQRLKANMDNSENCRMPARCLAGLPQLIPAEVKAAYLRMLVEAGFAISTQ